MSSAEMMASPATTLAAQRRRRGAQRGIRVVVHGFQLSVVPISLVLVWHFAVATDAVPSTLVANPADSLSKLVELTRDGTLTTHAIASVRRISIGFVLGTSIGIAVGSIIGTTRVGSRVLEPVALTLIPVPAVAWIPLLVVVLGIGEESKIALVAIGSATTLILATASGIRGASQDLVEVARLYEKKPLTILRTVLLPAATPGIVASGRVAMALSWTLLVAAEVIASADGLGWFIWDSRNFARPASMMAGMLAIGILGKATDAAISAGGRWLTRWDRSYRA